MCHKTFSIFMKFHEAKDCGIPFVLLLSGFVRDDIRYHVQSSFDRVRLPTLYVEC